MSNRKDKLISFTVKVEMSKKTYQTLLEFSHAVEAEDPSDALRRAAAIGLSIYEVIRDGGYVTLEPKDKETIIMNSIK